MKNLIVFCLAVFLSVGFAHHADAKRFGGGGFGKSFKTSPFKKQSSPFQQKKSEPSKGSDQQRNAAPANNAAPAKGKGMMGGLMGGLLAGGIFAALLGSGAFEGVQIMDILLIALVAFIGFKLLRGMRRPAPAAAGYGTAPRQEAPTAQFRMNTGNQGGGETPMNVPVGFNQNAFLDGALDHYRTLQAAWNEGNLDVVREYVSPELYAELHNQRKEMGVAPQTEILDLDAELVRADQQDGFYQLSILFRGRCKDDVEASEDGIFDVWHLQKPAAQDDAPWLIVGIEAEG